MPIDEFLARMLFFLPNKHEKSVRYYGIYVRPARKIKLESREKKSNWAQAIKSSFDTKDPLACPASHSRPSPLRQGHVSGSGGGGLLFCSGDWTR